MPKFPPTATCSPAVRAISPTRVVTVLLPLEPVMATMGALAYWRNRSTSPRMATPACLACWIAGNSRLSPGLTSNWSAWVRKSPSRGPRRTSTWGSSAFNSSSPGGAKRVSTTANGRPLPARKRAQDNPVLPSPTTMVSLSDAIRAMLASYSKRSPLTNLQGGQANQDQHYRNNPKAHNHAGLRPAFQLKVMVQGRHPENTPASQLVGTHL